MSRTLRAKGNESRDIGVKGMDIFFDSNDETALHHRRGKLSGCPFVIAADGTVWRAGTSDFCDDLGVVAEHARSRSPYCSITNFRGHFQNRIYKIFRHLQD
jgi:hypothetical protein